MRADRVEGLDVFDMFLGAQLQLDGELETASARARGEGHVSDETAEVVIR